MKGEALDNESLVAVIGAGSALVGALIGAGGAVLAARSQARAARYQAYAQSRAQHEQWLREQLRNKYAEVIEVINTSLFRAMEVPIHIMEGRSELARDTLLNLDLDVLRKHSPMISVEAPRSVVRPFYALLGALEKLKELAPRITEPTTHERELQAALLRELTRSVAAQSELSIAVREVMRPLEDDIGP